MSLHPAARQRLLDLHKNLMRLHKILLDSERRAYEEKHGVIPSAAQVLNLVMHDPWFDWLHRISEGIIRIDEILDNKNSTFDDASECLSSFRALFQGTENTEFMVRYRAVLQRESAAVQAHMEVQKLLVTDA